MTPCSLRSTSPDVDVPSHPTELRCQYIYQIKDVLMLIFGLLHPTQGLGAWTYTHRILDPQGPVWTQDPVDPGP